MNSAYKTLIITPYGWQRIEHENIIQLKLQNKFKMHMLYDEAGKALNAGRLQATVELLEAAKMVQRIYMTPLEIAYAEA